MIRKIKLSPLVQVKLGSQQACRNNPCRAVVTPFFALSFYINKKGQKNKSVPFCFFSETLYQD
jgi:hypothetical protein